MKTFSRHGFLSILAMVLVACASHTDKASNQINVGVQLHSVKNDVSRDFEGTLQKLAAAGVDGVEFAGRYGPYVNDPHGLRRFLEKTGLEVSGVHAPTTALRGEKGRMNFAFYRDLGAKTVIIPHDKRINDPLKIEELYAELRQLNTLANGYGLLLGYHNHSKEFETYQGKTYWEHLAENTPDNFVLQLDIGWATYAGHDPIALIKEHPNRTITTHYKIRTYKGKPSTVEKDAKVIIGSGDIDWQALYKTNQNYGGTDWVIVEQEEYPEGITPFESLTRSYHALKSKVH